jgi:hypothetical protein
MAVQTAVITQLELQKINDLKSELSKKEAELEDLISNVKALLFAKAQIESGRFDARLSFKRMHNVAWKEIVIEKLGFEYAEAVRKASPTVTRCEVIVIEHAIPPLWKQRDVETGTEPTS